MRRSHPRHRHCQLKQHRFFDRIFSLYLRQSQRLKWMYTSSTMPRRMPPVVPVNCCDCTKTSTASNATLVFEGSGDRQQHLFEEHPSHRSAGSGASDFSSHLAPYWALYAPIHLRDRQNDYRLERQTDHRADFFYADSQVFKCAGFESWKPASTDTSIKAGSDRISCSPIYRSSCFYFAIMFIKNHETNTQNDAESESYA